MWNKRDDRVAKRLTERAQELHLVDIVANMMPEPHGLSSLSNKHSVKISAETRNISAHNSVANRTLTPASNQRA